MRLSFALLASLLTLSACVDEPSNPDAPAGPDGASAISFRPDGTLAFVRSGDTLSTIAIEIAATDSARRRGLMERETLPAESGMLFIFERGNETNSFWMGNTPLSLDLFFAGADSQITSIHKYARPFSPESIRPAAPARFVVEVPAGFADSEGIVEGDRLRWQRD